MPGVNGRPCKTCHHPDRLEIEAKALAGAEIESLARAHGLTASSLGRHVKAHITKSLIAADQARTAIIATQIGGSVLDRVRQLNEIVVQVLKAAAATDNLGGVLQSVDRALRGVEAEATLLENIANATLGQEKEFVFRWETPKVCEYCGHDPGACEDRAVAAQRAGRAGPDDHGDTGAPAPQPVP